MSMTVTRRKDNRTPKVLMHRIADIRGGVSVKVSELGDDFLPEGAVLSAPDANGLVHIVKVATVAADVTAEETTVKVKKLSGLKVGDFVMVAVGAVAVAVTAIDKTNKSYDTLTLASAIGALSIGDQLAEAKEGSTASQKKSALKYAPLAINGTGKTVEQNTNLDTDAWLIAVTKGNPLPDFIATALKGVVNY